MLLWYMGTFIIDDVGYSGLIIIVLEVTDLSSGIYLISVRPLASSYV